MASKTNFLLKYHLDYLIPIAIWLLIFTKNAFSNIILVDYVPMTFFDIGKAIVSNDYNYVFSVIDILRIIAAPLNLYYLIFTCSILISMIVSYFYIKRTFNDKPVMFSIIFSLIYFFNPFVYSRIMIGQLGVLIAYLLIPIYVYYLFSFFNSGLKKIDLLKLVIAFTLCSSVSIHFFVINFIIFIIANIWLYNKNIKLSKYLSSLILILFLLLLLNSFWIQGFFSNKIFSAIDSSHEFFFSPKMSENVPAVEKIIGMYGFWREDGYLVAYKDLPLAVTIIGLSLLILLMITGYCIESSKTSKIFFTLFWVGLILGTGISHPYTRPFFDFLFKNVPFFNGFRDSHKFVSLIALSYAFLIAQLVPYLKSKLKSSYFIVIVSLLIIFIIAYSYPLIGLNNQIKSVEYPSSYYNINSYLETKDTSGYIVYLPYQSYLTYSWSKDSSSDGRIAVPINQIVKKTVIVGADRWGTYDDITSRINDCITKKDVSCLKQSGVEYVLYDKCAYYPDTYEFITNNSKDYSTSCIDVYKINNSINSKTQITPDRFKIGVLTSILTFLIILFFLIKGSSKE